MITNYRSAISVHVFGTLDYAGFFMNFGTSPMRDYHGNICG
jgi:hypothetical protein